MLAKIIFLILSVGAIVQSAPTRRPRQPAPHEFIMLPSDYHYMPSDSESLDGTECDGAGGGGDSATDESDEESRARKRVVLTSTTTAAAAATTVQSEWVRMMNLMNAKLTEKAILDDLLQCHVILEDSDIAEDQEYQDQVQSTRHRYAALNKEIEETNERLKKFYQQPANSTALIMAGPSGERLV